MGKIYKNNKFKISAPTWNDKSELHDGSYSVSDIQDYFEYFIKNHEKVSNSPPIAIYVNRIEGRITFKIKTGYYLDVLTPEALKLLGSTKKKLTKDKNDESVPHLEIPKEILVHCNFVNNGY